MPAVQDTIDRVRKIDVDQYKYGFQTEIAVDKAPKGLSEDIIRFISAKKDEPSWMLEWRLEAYRRWLTLEEPTWARVHYPKIDFQDIYYYAAPKSTPGPSSLSDVDPELLKVYEKLGIPLREQEILAGVQKTDASDLEEPSDNVYKSGRVAVDAVFDSVSVVTTFKKELAQAGVIFCSISEAIREHPELVQKYLGSVVPTSDNFYATLNSAVFTDGSFVFVPKGVRCPMELSTYFRMNEKNTGQFERTLIIAEEGAYVSYLEGCTAPQRDENQLHARWSNWWRSTMPRSNIRRCRTGIPATPRARAASTISSPSAATAVATARRSRGRRSRPVLRSLGSIRAASCAATIPRANSIRSPCRTAISRSIAAPR